MLKNSEYNDKENKTIFQLLSVVHKLCLLSQEIFIVENEEKKLNIFTECLLKCKTQSIFQFLKNK